MDDLLGLNDETEEREEVGIVKDAPAIDPFQASAGLSHYLLFVSLGFACQIITLSTRKTL